MIATYQLSKDSDISKCLQKNQRLRILRFYQKFIYTWVDRLAKSVSKVILNDYSTYSVTIVEIFYKCMQL